MRLKITVFRISDNTNSLVREANAKEIVDFFFFFYNP